MNVQKWLENNTASLTGKLVAITGSTGGLGQEICRFLLDLNASLILLDRNAERSGALRERLLEEFQGASVRCINVDLENIDSVRSAVSQLLNTPLDIFIHNAGAYSIPRHKSSTGFDNVFQINFVSPYYIINELLPLLNERSGRVVVVGSIAHNYSKTDAKDIDFSKREQASKVYGNAKRYLMFSLYPLSKKAPNVSFSVTHPGISFTNITAHYPKLIFAIIKHPMKIIFMKPRIACLSVIRGVFEDCKEAEWIGPRFFDIWGLPQKKLLKTASSDEREFIVQTAEKIYHSIKEN